MQKKRTKNEKSNYGCRILPVLIFFILIIFSNKKHTETFYALDTIINITAYGKNAKVAVLDCAEMIKQSEKKLSAYEDSSELWRINDAGFEDIMVESDVFELIEIAHDISNETGGYFDFTVKPLVDLWNIKGGGHVPDASEIENAIIDLGGNVLVVGDNKQKLWSVGLQNPNSARGNYFGIVKVSNKSIVSSGAYERYFEKEGEIYHHILNPFTGLCADDEITSVTIVCEKSVTADAISTAVYVMGLGDGMKFLEGLSGIEYIIVDKNNNVYVK